MALRIYLFAKCQRYNVRYREYVSHLMLNCIEIPFHYISVSFDGRNWGFIMEIINAKLESVIDIFSKYNLNFAIWSAAICTFCKNSIS